VCSNGKDVPVKAADWAKLVDQLREAGKVAYQAAKSKNLDKMFDASDVLNTACSNCHNKYRRANRCQ
jgi:cytochrome c556